MAKHLLHAVTNGNFNLGGNSISTSRSNSSENQTIFYCCNNNDGNAHRLEDNQSLRSTDEEISNAELGLAEDHFAGHFGLSTIEELEMAIEQCKEFILEAPEKSERRKSLVKKLVKLRLKLQEVKEGPEVIPPDVCLVSCHKFEKKKMEKMKVKRYCEKCNGNIWGVLNTWYQCQECRFSCHGKCLNLITRVCASVKVKENPVYNLEICPEKGLSAQNFRCAECRCAVMPKTQSMEPRLCDYNGFYYCPNCHWNSLMVIPARVLHNWDFESRKVSRASKQFLLLMKKKAVLNVEEINPMLFTFVEELSMVKKLREEILIMKKYFLSCKEALESKILLRLSSRQHFVDSVNMYSMQDLEDTRSGILLEFLGVVRSVFVKHIKEDCKACQGKGYICQICNADEIIFPFDDKSSSCSICTSVFHTECFYRKDQTCPKCQRLAEKVPSHTLHYTDS